MPKISIVAPYFNRKRELWHTLKVMEKSLFKDFEFIIVDDGSDAEQRIEDFNNIFSFLKLIRIEPKDKYYINPCIPYNLALSRAVGDIVILQSPECMHMGDVLNFVANNTRAAQYLVFSCYSLGRPASSLLQTVDFNCSIEELEMRVVNTLGRFSDKSCDVVGRYDSWFAHPSIRPCMYNFLVSMPMKDMMELGGFDERFAYGHAYDDTNFADRVLKKKMEVIFVDKPYCLHQFHPPMLYNVPNFAAKEQKNRLLYEELLKDPNYSVINSFVKETN